MFSVLPASLSLRFSVSEHITFGLSLDYQPSDIDFPLTNSSGYDLALSSSSSLIPGMVDTFQSFQHRDIGPETFSAASGSIAASPRCQTLYDGTFVSFDSLCFPFSSSSSSQQPMLSVSLPASHITTFLICTWFLVRNLISQQHCNHSKHHSSASFCSSPRACPKSSNPHARRPLLLAVRTMSSGPHPGWWVVHPH